MAACLPKSLVVKGAESCCFSKNIGTNGCLPPPPDQRQNPPFTDILVHHFDCARRNAQKLQEMDCGLGMHSLFFSELAFTLRRPLSLFLLVQGGVSNQNPVCILSLHVGIRTPQRVALNGKPSVTGEYRLSRPEEQVQVALRTFN